MKFMVGMEVYLSVDNPHGHPELKKGMKGIVKEVGMFSSFIDFGFRDNRRRFHDGDCVIKKPTGWQCLNSEISVDLKSYIHKLNEGVL